MEKPDIRVRSIQEAFMRNKAGFTASIFMQQEDISKTETYHER